MIPYTPDETEDFKRYFEAQATQTGFGFVGQPYQRGAGLGSIFSGLFRAVAPLAKSALKTVGDTAAKTGLEIASDALQGHDLSEAVQHRTKEAAGHLLEAGKRKLNATGPPAKRRRQRRRRQRGDGLGFRNDIRLLKSINADNCKYSDVFSESC